MAAGACSWLEAYVEFSRTWSPRAYDDFHVSIGLWLLSTVAGRRITVDLSGERYTNLYLALLARTGLHAKSTTANIGMAVLKEAGLTHFWRRTTLRLRPSSVR
jgi:hypothetical protein